MFTEETIEVMKKKQRRNNKYKGRKNTLQSFDDDNIILVAESEKDMNRMLQKMKGSLRNRR